jgi:glutamate formiminotransferase
VNAGARPLVECVPNFSEGRRPEVVAAIADAMRAEGVKQLDQTMDADHNRSVITLAGEPEALAAAVVQGIGKAGELIDLTKHTGTHPRLGAADVVPFVPLAGISLVECAALARRVGEEVWKNFKIPVYLYEAAALREDRVRLEQVRRGGFEGIGAAVAADPSRRPDIGGPGLHPTAGASIIGARKFLIAFNIFLESTELEVARQVARAVRASSGGLPCVKALGMKVRGMAQVSMNLTDFEATSLATLFRAVEGEARRRGVGVAGSELIGLIPRRALPNPEDVDLRIEGFNDSMILENRLSR